MRGLRTVTPWALLTCVVCGHPSAPAQSSVYRCGSTYQSSPCPGAQVVEVDDSRSRAQQAQSQQAALLERRLAADLTQQRRAREAVAPARTPPKRPRTAVATDPAPKPDAPACLRKAKHRSVPVGGCRDEILYVDPNSVPTKKKASGHS